MKHVTDILLLCLGLSLLASGCPGEVTENIVRTDAELRAALDNAKAGTTIVVQPGTYTGGIFLNGLTGTARTPIVIEGAPGEERPLFTGGTEALHLVGCNHVVLRHLAVRGYPGNGINADDAGTLNKPAVGLLFEDLLIEHTGPTGNHDALKLSGLDDFEVRNCAFRGWGGSAIDMVGCHNGRIRNCSFYGLEGFDQSSGVQLKGGTRNVLVDGCFFLDAGLRAVNLGGSTGLPYFRPQNADYEARDVTIAGNRFVGSQSPVAWVTSDAGHVHHNTIVYPGKWVLRILQETTDPRFVTCRNGVFEHNLVVFDDAVSTFVNVGPNTAPETFDFSHNAWFDANGTREPQLPVAETDGVYGVDPRLANLDSPALRATSSDARLEGIGANHYEAAP